MAQGQSQELFRAVLASIVEAGAGRAITVGRDHRALLTVMERRALEACGGLAPWASHVSTLSRSLSIDPGEAEILLSSLAGRGLLFGTDAIRAAAGTCPSEDAACIHDIAIFTHHRPESLERCLKGYLENLLLYDRRSCRVVVWDDSTEPGFVSATRAAVQALGAATPLRVVYADIAARARFCKRLAETGVPPDVCEFALLPRPRLTGPGANRNAALLDNLGRLSLFVDDDTSALSARHPEAENGLLICGHDDPREVRFFADRREAVDASSWLGLDLVGAHERLLGKSLRRCVLETAPDGLAYGDVCGHVLAAASSPDARVAYTMPGKIGDCGRGSAAWIAAALSRPSHGANTTPEGLFAGPELPREVREASKRAAVVHDVGCMATVLGLDGRLALPPFLPHCRSQDAVFGLLIGRSMPEALVGLPNYSVLHDAAPGRRYPSRQALRFWNVVAALLGAVPPAMIEGCGPAAVQRRLGRWLDEAGSMTTGDFRRFVGRALPQHYGWQLRRAAAQLAPGGTIPPALRRQLARSFEEISNLAVEGAPTAPLEFLGMGAGAWDAARREVRDFGRLLMHWDEICRTTRKLYSGGLGLTDAATAAAAG